MTDRTLKSKLDKLHQLQAEIDALTTQADALKAQVKTELEARGLDELEAGNYIVRWKPVNSTRFDTKQFKAEHAKLYQQYAATTTTRRFTLATA